MERPLRILVLNYEFPPVGGGGGRVAEDLCRALAARGHAVRVLTSHAAGLPRRERRDGYDVRRYPALRRRRDRCSPAEMAGYLALGAAPVVHEALTWRPDVTHAHFAVPTGPLAWLARRCAGVPYVLTAHLGDVPGGWPQQTDRLFKAVNRFAAPVWRGAAAVTAVSEFTRRLAVAAYGVPVETVLNGVDLRACRPGPGRPSPVRRLLFVGRLTVQKKALFLLDVLARLRDLPWALDVLGDGPTRPAVEARVAQHGLGGRVRLHGWVSPEAVEAAMAADDVLVMPSLSEGLSVVAVRALAFGLAVLASDVGGNLDVVRPGANGFLCPVNDPDAFTACLRRLLLEDDLLAAMKRASRELAAAFDLDRIVSRYEAIFRGVVQRRRAA
jgi:glycosyltransferase involved in cell wall biosynthesis